MITLLQIFVYQWTGRTTKVNIWWRCAKA